MFHEHRQYSITFPQQQQQQQDADEDSPPCGELDLCHTSHNTMRLSPVTLVTTNSTKNEVIDHGELTLRPRHLATILGLLAYS